MKKSFLLTCFAANLAAQTLDVHVYDWATVPAPTLDQTAGELVRIFRVSGIQIRWIVEPPDSPEAHQAMLVNPPFPGREREVACAARRDIALSILLDSSAKLKPGILGYAEPLAPAGVNATVYYARIADAAENSGSQIGVFLAHAISHEIGHVLLRTAAHRKGGIMSGGWNAVQFRMIRNSGLFFGDSDARLMRAAIDGEGCPQPTREPGLPSIARR